MNPQDYKDLIVKIRLDIADKEESESWKVRRAYRILYNALSQSEDLIDNLETELETES